MRVLLVNPPRSPHNMILDCAPEEARRFVHRKLIGPPLGLLTVAASASHHDVALLEMKGEYDLDPAAPAPGVLLEQWMKRHRPDVVGVTFIASEHPAGMEILRHAKRIDPEVLTVAGGLHATLCPDHFDDPAVDVVYTSVAAHGFAEILDAREAGRDLDAVGGILVREDGRLRPTPVPEPERDVTGRDFIFPDRSHLERWLQTYLVPGAPGITTYVYTSLGCPHRCTFCSIWPQQCGRYHLRDPRSVVDEIKTLDEYPVVRFADGNTLVDLEFIERLFTLIEREGIDKEWVMDVRADTAARHPRLIERLARDGLKVVITGFESHRARDLERYGKRLDVDLVDEAIRVYHENGIMVRGNWVVPPDYDEADFDSLAEYASRHRVALSGYTILTPMPGTGFHRDVEDEIVDRDLSRYNFFNCVMRTRLPIEKFYEKVGDLWRIRLGDRII